jgi:hypothetical protein
MLEISDSRSRVVIEQLAASPPLANEELEATGALTARTRSPN